MKSLGFVGFTIAYSLLGIVASSAAAKATDSTFIPTNLQPAAGALTRSAYQTGGSQLEMRVASIAAPEVRGIQNSFQEVFGRDANRDEVEVWQNALSQEPMGYSMIVQRHKTWLFSDSGQNELTQVIQRSYQTAFGRAASSSDIQTWKRYAPENRWGYKDIVSKHRQWLVSGTPEATSELRQVITRSYRQVFGREASQDELNVWEPEIRAHQYTYTEVVALHKKWQRGER